MKKRKAVQRRHRGRAYGDKRDYPKIDLYVGGRYVATTTWARTVAEAKAKYIEKLTENERKSISPSTVKAFRQKK
jgi:hypothetical protein